VSARRRCGAEDVRLRGGEQGRVHRVRTDLAAGRGAVDRRGVLGRSRTGSDLWDPNRDCGAAAPGGARRGRAGDHGRPGEHEVPGQGRQWRGEAGRAARDPGRERAGVPASASGATAVGRRPGDGNAVARARPDDRRPGCADRRGGAGHDARARGGAAAARTRTQPGPAAGARPQAPALDRRAAGAGTTGAGPRGARGGADDARRPCHPAAPCRPPSVPDGRPAAAL